MSVFLKNGEQDCKTDPVLGSGPVCVTSYKEKVKEYEYSAYNMYSFMKMKKRNKLKLFQEWGNKGE
jgi:hypothetical protein